jgi:hypothetical protein
MARGRHRITAGWGLGPIPERVFPASICASGAAPGPAHIVYNIAYNMIFAAQRLTIAVGSDPRVFAKSEVIRT